MDLLAMTKQDFPIHASIPIKEGIEKKVLAVNCYSSQNSGIKIPLFIQKFFLSRNENYMQAFPQVASNRITTNILDFISE
jgi:hypothetical protein